MSLIDVVLRLLFSERNQDLYMCRPNLVKSDWANENNLSTILAYVRTLSFFRIVSISCLYHIVVCILIILSNIIIKH